MIPTNVSSRGFVLRRIGGRFDAAARLLVTSTGHRTRYPGMLATVGVFVLMLLPLIFAVAFAVGAVVVQRHEFAVAGAGGMTHAMFLAKRSSTAWKTAPADGGTSDIELTPGLVQNGGLLTIPYAVNVTTAGAAVRARSLPVKRISLIAGTTTLQTIRGVDLITTAMIFEQTPIGALLTPAGGFAIANYTSLFAQVPIHFNQPHAANGFRTALPSYEYQRRAIPLILRVEWGSVTDLLTGTPVGPITFGAGSAGPTLTQLEYGDLYLQDGLAFAKTRKRTVERYVDTGAFAAAANGALELKIGTTSDIRGILITSELTSTGEPTDTIINTVTLKENKNQEIFSKVPWSGLRADNGKLYGVTMPTGVGVIDFAEDGDIDNIYRATQKSDVSLFFDIAAVAGTIRAHLMTIENSPF